MTQLPLTLSTSAFFPTHDRAYERADGKSDEPTSIDRSDAKNTEDHGRVYASRVIGFSARLLSACGKLDSGPLVTFG